MWKGATHDAMALARLGLETLSRFQCAKDAPEIDPNTGVLQPGVEAADIPNRTMSFVCNMLEARFWSYAVYQWSWPRAFAVVFGEGGDASKAVLSLCQRHRDAC